MHLLVVPWPSSFHTCTIRFFINVQHWRYVTINNLFHNRLDLIIERIWIRHTSGVFVRCYDVRDATCEVFVGIIADMWPCTILLKDKFCISVESYIEHMRTVVMLINLNNWFNDFWNISLNCYTVKIILTINGKFRFLADTCIN